MIIGDGQVRKFLDRELKKLMPLLLSYQSQDLHKANLVFKESNLTYLNYSFLDNLLEVGQV